MQKIQKRGHKFEGDQDRWFIEGFKEHKPKRWMF